MPADSSYPGYEAQLTSRGWTVMFGSAVQVVDARRLAIVAALIVILSRSILEVEVCHGVDCCE